MIAAVAMMSPTVPPITTPPAILPAFEPLTTEEYVLEEDVGVAAGSSLEKTLEEVLEGTLEGTPEWVLEGTLEWVLEGTLEWVLEGTLEGPMSEQGPNSGESIKQVE